MKPFDWSDPEHKDFFVKSRAWAGNHQNRAKDGRCGVGFSDGGLSAYTTRSRRGVRLRIPPICMYGTTVTLEEYREWDARG